MSTSAFPDADPARSARMRLFALAEPAELAAAVGDLGRGLRWSLLRAPETGMVMARGRIGGDGAPFNLGEVTATRCTVALEDGPAGYACILGRDRDKALHAAILDAAMQVPETAPLVERRLLVPLGERLAAADAAADRKTAATKVDFFTLVRGD